MGQCIHVLFENDDEDWEDVIPSLVNKISNNQTVVESIETLGYICATVRKKAVIEVNINQILKIASLPCSSEISITKKTLCLNGCAVFKLFIKSILNTNIHSKPFDYNF